MNIRDKQLYNLLDEFATQYIDKLSEAKDDEDFVDIFFYKGKLDTIMDICMYLNVPMFDKLQQDILETMSNYWCFFKELKIWS